MRTRLPEAGEFTINGFNNQPNRVYLAVVEVAGTPYEARGWGKAHKESVNRAAMMYEMIIQTLVVHNTPKQFGLSMTTTINAVTTTTTTSSIIPLPCRWRSNVHFTSSNSTTNANTNTNKNRVSGGMSSSSPISSMSGGGHGVLFDMTKDKLNTHGKMIALALFAATTPPFETLRVTRRDRTLPFSSSSSSSSSHGTTS